MKTLKEFLESKNTNNGKEIALDIVRAYFGYEPKKLSDENMKCEKDEDMYKLIENMELHYANQPNSKDPTDETERDTIHAELTNWVKTHNK